MSEIGVDLGEEFPKPLTDEFVQGRRRRDHDGLWRRLPDLPGQALRGLGARRSCRARPRDSAADPRRDRQPRPGADRRAPARVSEAARAASARSLAEAIGTFALVFAGCGAIMVDAKTHQLGHVGVAISFGLVIMVDDLRRRPRLRRALQRRRHLRLRAHPALPLAARARLLGGAVRRRARRRGAPARLAREHRPRRRDAARPARRGSRSSGSS